MDHKNLQTRSVSPSSSSSNSTACSVISHNNAGKVVETSNPTVLNPDLSPGETSVGLTFNVNRRKRMTRTKRSRSLASIPTFVPVNTAPASFYRLPESYAVVENQTGENNNLLFLMQKELRNSDVGSLGRVVLPKREAERYFPTLIAKEGMYLNMEDSETQRIWYFRYRFWPNNKSRMYVLENTGDYIKEHNLRCGDVIMFYRDDVNSKYVIRARKTGAAAERPPSMMNIFGVEIEIPPSFLTANPQAIAGPSDVLTPEMDSDWMLYPPLESVSGFENFPFDDLP